MKNKICFNVIFLIVLWSYIYLAYVCEFFILSDRIFRSVKISLNWSLNLIVLKFLLLRKDFLQVIENWSPFSSK